MIVDHRIEGTRITVWDVLHHLENDWPIEEIAEVLGLSEQQIQAAVNHIRIHNAEVKTVHQQIEERNARGNAPNVQVKVDAARTRRLEWLEQRQNTTTR